jgi:hypothetical protein
MKVFRVELIIDNDDAEIQSVCKFIANQLNVSGIRGEKPTMVSPAADDVEPNGIT